MNKTTEALKYDILVLKIAARFLHKAVSAKERCDYWIVKELIAKKEMQLAEPVKQEPVAAMKKPNVEVITADVRAALCFALWHHQGGSSSIGQMIREIIGPGQHDHMTSEQYFAAKRVAEALAEQEKLVPKVSHGLCGGCAKTAADGWALYCVECWEKAEPVKQEPVYAFRRRGLDDFCTCTKERYEELADMPNLFEVTTFYAAPIDAKAIRAEALKEAEEIAKTIGGSFADEFLAATRELK